MKDEQAEADLPVRVVRLALVGQHLEHDGGRAERDEKAREECGPPVHAEEGEQSRRQERRQPDLQAAAAEDQLLDAGESFEAELDADGEQQQDDADLRGGVHQLPVAHEAEGVRADEHPCEQEADDGDEPEALADVRDERARGDERDRLNQKWRGRSGGDKDVHRGTIIRHAQFTAPDYGKRLAAAHSPRASGGPSAERHACKGN